MVVMLASLMSLDCPLGRSYPNLRTFGPGMKEGTQVSPLIHHKYRPHLKDDSPVAYPAQVGTQGSRQMHEISQALVYKNTALAGLFNWFLLWGPWAPYFLQGTRHAMSLYVFMVSSIRLILMALVWPCFLFS